MMRSKSASGDAWSRFGSFAAAEGQKKKTACSVKAASQSLLCSIPRKHQHACLSEVGQYTRKVHVTVIWHVEHQEKVFLNS